MSTYFRIPKAEIPNEFLLFNQFHDCWNLFSSYLLNSHHNQMTINEKKFIQYHYYNNSSYLLPITSVKIRMYFPFSEIVFNNSTNRNYLWQQEKKRNSFLLLIIIIVVAVVAIFIYNTCIYSF